MLKNKKSMLKSSKKPSEGSSSEDQRIREKKVEESSSSEIPKGRNLKPRCLTIKLKAAEDVAKESERPVLTERGEDAPIATPEVEVTTATTGIDEPNDEREVVKENGVPTESVQGIYASEASN